MRQFLFAVVALLSAGIVRADVESGPKAGEKVGDFKVFGVTGLVEGKEVNYVKERKDEPTIYVFVQKEHFSRPIAQLLKKLDAASNEADEKSKVIVVWLTEKPDEAKDYLPKLQNALNFVHSSLAVFPGEKSGPNGWSINTDAHLTVVVTKNGKVAANFAFVSLSDKDVPKVKEAIKKAK